MWCLETIIALNQKLAEGKDHDAAYAEVGINLPRMAEEIPVQAEEPQVWEMKQPPLKAAS